MYPFWEYATFSHTLLWQENYLSSQNFTNSRAYLTPQLAGRQNLSLWSCVFLYHENSTRRLNIDSTKHNSGPTNQSGKRHSDTLSANSAVLLGRLQNIEWNPIFTTLSKYKILEEAMIFVRILVERVGIARWFRWWIKREIGCGFAVVFLSFTFDWWYWMWMGI